MYVSVNFLFQREFLGLQFILLSNFLRLSLALFHYFCGLQSVNGQFHFVYILPCMCVSISILESVLLLALIEKQFLFCIPFSLRFFLLWIVQLLHFFVLLCVVCAVTCVIYGHLPITLRVWWWFVAISPLLSSSSASKHFAFDQWLVESKFTCFMFQHMRIIFQIKKPKKMKIQMKIFVLNLLPFLARAHHTTTTTIQNIFKIK